MLWRNITSLNRNKKMKLLTHSLTGWVIVCRRRRRRKALMNECWRGERERETQKKLGIKKWYFALWDALQKQKRMGIWIRSAGPFSQWRFCFLREREKQRGKTPKMKTHKTTTWNLHYIKMDIKVVTITCLPFSLFLSLLRLFLIHVFGFYKLFSLILGPVIWVWNFLYS